MIARTEVDGIPVLAAPDSGPIAAGITFRVGYADERLARSGVTHLIEHLALHRLGVTNYHFNGTTGPFFTTFYSQGSVADVTGYLVRVCEALADLPMDRLSLEKEVLRTEAEGRPSGIGDRLWLWRHGSRGMGLAGYREVGLPELGPDDLRDWLGRYFTRGNAALWFTGMAAPEDLRLLLPHGIRQPVPQSPSVLPVLPAHFPDAGNRIGLEVRVERSFAARAYAAVLERELFRRLRQDGGLSYSVTTDYLPVDADTAAIFAVADASEDRQSAALGEFVDVVAGIRWGRIDPSELAEITERLRTDLANPLADAGRLPAEACDLLIGSELLSTQEILRQVAEVTPADVSRVAEAASATGLLALPPSLSADWAGFAVAPGWSTTTVPGQPVVAHNDPDRSLVVGTDGVSEIRDGVAATVLFSDCQAMLAWPDGGRHLVGGDAVSCSVEPTLYPLDPRVIGYLDQRIPPSLVVRQPPRRPDAIPTPPTPPPPAAGGLARTLARRLRRG